MESQKPVKLTSKSYLTTLTILYGAIIFGVLAFAIIAYAEFGGGDKLRLSYTDDTFFFLVPLLMLGGFFGGDMLFNKKVISVENRTSLKEKLMGFQTALIIKLALLEIPIIISIVVYIMQQNLYYMLWVGIGVLYLSLLKPSKGKIESILKLKKEDREHLADPNFVIE